MHVQLKHFLAYIQAVFPTLAAVFAYYFIPAKVGIKFNKINYVRILCTTKLLYYNMHTYRFNATSHSHSSDTIPLAQCLNSIECVFNGSNSGSNLSLKENLREQFSKLKMILRALLILIIKRPPTGSG